MEKTEHCLIVGDGARVFADEIGIPRTASSELVTDAGRAEYEQYSAPGYKGTVNELFDSETSGHDTVGCVAFDANGHLAAGTSTGGITMKRPGRVGDSPLIGCGGAADDSIGACSSTGHGEAILRTTLAAAAMSKMEAGLSPNDATEAALHRMWRLVGGRGGLIAIDRRGRIGRHSTTTRMAWASAEGAVGASEPIKTARGIDNDAGHKGVPPR